MKFKILNQRILGLNILWSSWNLAYQEIKWTHWECTKMELQALYKRMLKWSTKCLTVPLSMSALGKIIQKANSNYIEAEVKRLPASEVIVEKVALPETNPNIIPLISILPKKEAEWYAKEENLITKDSKQWEELAKFKVKLGIKFSEYVQIIKRLMEFKMVEIRPTKEVKVINGLQCVSKPDGKQRLIFDGRPVNLILIEPEKVQLPDFALVSDWLVRKEEIIRFGKLDIDNFYHRLGVPDWMKSYLGLPEIKAEMIGQGRGWVCPVCRTLPMGLSHSVLLAQKAYINLLQGCSTASSINKRANNDIKMWILIYIDNVIIAVKNNKATKAEKELNEYLEEILQAYNKAGLPVNQQKIERAKETITGLGCRLSSKEKGIFPKQNKITEVVAATKILLHCERANTKVVEALLGHWVWFFLLCRPFYSIFFHTYRWLHNEDHQGQREIWKSVKREFLLAILFIDKCSLLWERENDESLLASDASLQGAGACEINIKNIMQQQLSEDGIQDLRLGQWDWETILNQKWQKKEHINVLEMRALLMATLKWLESPQHLRTRWRILVDSKIRRYRRLLRRSTVKQYAAIIHKFRKTVGRINFEGLDAQLLDYIQVIPTLAQRSNLENLVAAFKHFFPEVVDRLPRVKRFTKQLQRQYKGITKPPMIWDVVVLIIIKLIDISFPTTALAVYLQFDCFLRPNELCNIITEHVAFPGGNLLGSQAQKVLILLPITKTGPLQSVRVESTLVQQLLARLVTQATKNTKLFPSYYNYRKRLAQVIEMLGLTHIGYTPHSIRHGAAIMALINESEKSLPGIMYQGRWESSAGKAYLQMGAAALLFAELPEYLIRRAKKLERELPKAFANVKLIPAM